MPRVVVTGFGVISSIGTGAEEFTSGLREGRSNVRPITGFDTTGFAYANGTEVADFDPGRWIRNVEVDSLGRAAQFAVASARMAVEDAGLDLAGLAAKRGVVSIGTTDGESRDVDSLVETEVNAGREAMEPIVARRVSAGRMSAAVAHELRLPRVEAATIATACAAGNYSIGNGFDAIRTGEADYALCGGADAVCRKTFTGFYRLGTIAPEYCQPFDVNRKGILTGEGGAVLVLESLDSALARGARIYAEILGYGLACDAFHPTAPDQDGVARCIRNALESAGVKPHEVDLISAHGTGTKVNDITETRAIRDVYGDHVPPVVSLKSMLGHTMGAASALAAVACGLAISHGFIPPTINHTATDPECDIDCVPNFSKPADLSIIQNNALAFGGNDAVLILGKFQGQAA